MALTGFKTNRVVVVSEDQEVGLLQQAEARNKAKVERRDDGSEDLAALAASEYAPRFDPVQAVHATRPLKPTWVQGDANDIKRSGVAIKNAVARAFTQGFRMEAAKEALGLVFPERADLRKWQGATQMQKARAAVMVDRLVSGEDLKGPDEALAQGFLQATQATMGSSLALAARKVEEMAKAAGQGSDVLLGIESRSDNFLLRHGLDMKSFDPKVELKNAQEIEARREKWVVEQVVAVQGAMVAAGFVMPAVAMNGSGMERVRATTDMAAGFFSSLQGPGSQGVPSAHDVFSGMRAQEAVELSDPRVAPGFVLSPEVKASFDRFTNYYHSGNTDAIRDAVTRGQGAIRTLADSLGVEPRQADAMVSSAEHTATGLFSGPDARRLALYADSQRSMTVHTVDEFASWKVGSPEVLRYAGVVQNSLKTVAGGGLNPVELKEIERDLMDSFKQIQPHEAGVLFLGGFHPMVFLATLMSSPKPGAAREYMEAADELPQDPGFGKTWDHRAGTIVDPVKKQLIQFGQHEDVRIYGFSAGDLERIYQGSIEGAPLVQRLKDAHNDSKTALNVDQVMLSEAVQHGLVNLDYCLERNFSIAQIRPDAALALDGIPENEDIMDLFRFLGEEEAGLAQGFTPGRIELEER